VPTYRVDSVAQGMRATGVVNPAADMVESGGKWSNVGQARCKDTGFLLWDVEVLYSSEVYGQRSTCTVSVTVPWEVEAGPSLPEFAPVAFSNLRVVVSAPKNRPGSVSERWAADGIVGALKGASAVSGSSRAGRVEAAAGSVSGKGAGGEG
jgi:hypothetical protein